jgi:transposase-like protein
MSKQGFSVHIQKAVRSIVEVANTSLTLTKMTITSILRFQKYPRKGYELIRKNRWLHGVYCPYCGVFSVKLHRREKKGLNWYRCRDCRRIFSDLTKTIFDNTKMPLWKWFLAIYETMQKSGISSVELAEKISVNQKTAWRMLDSFRTAVKKYRPLLKGIVEGDETYHGGRRKGNRGRRMRFGNKVCIAGVVERKGKADVSIIEYVDECSLVKFIESRVKEDSTVYTDGFGGYNGLNWAGYVHDFVNHNKEFVRGKIHTQTIEGFWSYLKRKIRGTYYRVRTWNLLKYSKEFVLRYNTRSLKPQKRFEVFLGFAVNKI